MRAFPLTAATVLLAAVLAPAGAAAQSGRPIEITSVRVGLPGGPFTNDSDPQSGAVAGIFKPGCWTPVYVDIRCREKPDGPLTLTVEVPDADQVLARYSVPLPPLSAGQALTGIELPDLPYAKPGGALPDVTVSVTDARGRPYATPARGSAVARPSVSTVILTAGTRLDAFRVTVPKPPGNAAGPTDLGAAKLATADSVGVLPDRWFGYGSTDLVVLGTGSSADETGFVQQLFARENAARRLALVEWVRRGGKLVISVGRNWTLLSQIPEFRDLLPADAANSPRRQADKLRLLWSTRSQGLQEHTLTPASGQVPFVAWTPSPDRPAKESLMRVTDGPLKDKPLIVQAPLGLGRVTLVGFDLDAAPFTSWGEPAPFWDWLVAEAGARLPAPEDPTVRRFTPFGSRDEDDAQLGRLIGELERFEGVTVVSFGWVALLIIAYILVIGPGEYLFLKKVVKRLEWTWVTFPLTVLVVSLAAYFTAYAIKGDELRLVKYDAVDIDVQTKRVYGQTWFNVFSPRIQSYRVAVEPTGAFAPPAGQGVDSVVSGLGSSRTGGASLFQRSYDHRVDRDNGRYSDGLAGVPIQVWSTKAFAAEWSAPFDPAAPPIASALRHPDGAPNDLTGTLTSNLPFDTLQNATLFYRNEVYPLGTLVRGVEVPVVQGRERMAATDSLKRDVPIGGGNRWVNGQYQPDTFDARQALFHDALFPTEVGRAGSLRRLDQSWRLDKDDRDGAVLLATVPTARGATEEVFARPDVPTRLWLTELPGEAARAPVAGVVRQETVIRAFLPVPRR